MVNLKNGVSTRNDWNLFLSIFFSKIRRIEDKSQHFAMNQFQYEVCQIINVPVIQIYALHGSKTASYLCSDKMGDLETKLVLPIDARVMWTRKNWTNWRLCNGLIGDVKMLFLKVFRYPQDYLLLHLRSLMIIVNLAYAKIHLVVFQ